MALVILLYNWGMKVIGFGLTINFWLESFFPRRLNTRVGFRFYRLVDIIIRVFFFF